MKVKYALLLASLLSIGASTGAWAQLPPCNMGKAVHQPGDNQYNISSQMERHGTTYIDRTGPGSSVWVSHPGSGGGGGGSGGGGYVPAMAPMAVNPFVLMYTNQPKTDISIDPIACDEPVPPPGFPPLPERLLLPVSPTGSWNKPRSGGSGGRSGGGGGSLIVGVHEHYAHVNPGGFMAQKNGGGDNSGSYAPQVNPDAPIGGGGVSSESAIGGANPNKPEVAPGGSRGYYKCRTAPPIQVHRQTTDGDVYMGNDASAAGAHAPAYTGASSKDLKALGKAPSLDDAADGAGAPEAPQAATVSQATTQDLSLPDDEFVSRYGLQNTRGRRFGNFMGGQLRMVSQTAIMRAASLMYHY